MILCGEMKEIIKFAVIVKQPVTLTVTPAFGNRGFRLHFRQVDKLNGFHILDDLCRPSFPALKNLVPVLVIMAGPLMKYAVSFLYLLGVFNRIGIKVHISVKDA